MYLRDIIYLRSDCLTDLFSEHFKVGMWYLWDGQREIQLGPSLPSQYKDLGMRINFDRESVEERIMNGGSLEWLDRTD
jgi:hypothetical protein